MEFAPEVRLPQFTDLGSLGFVWEKSLRRYRDLSTGRFVSEAQLRSLSDGYREMMIEREVSRLTDRMIDGDISLGEWQVRMAQTLKRAYLVEYMISRGGRRMMEWSDFGRIGGRLRAEYRYLDGFAQEIKLGLLTPDMIRQRALLYARGSSTMYWEGLRASSRDAGMILERRVLHPAEHCKDCVEFERQGWQPLGTFPPPGLGSECLHNCKCTMEFQKEVE